MLSSPEWLTLLADLPDDVAHSMMGIAVALVLNNGASFHRRTKQLRSLPLLLLRFAEKPMSEPCDVRQRMAADILATPEPLMEPNTLKIYNAYKADMEHAAFTGECGPRLYAAMLLARMQFKPTVSQNERANSMIKMMCRRSPNVGLPLLSSRISLKACLGNALAQNTNKKALKCRILGEALDVSREHRHRPGTQTEIGD